MNVNGSPKENQVLLAGSVWGNKGRGEGEERAGKRGDGEGKEGGYLLRNENGNHVQEFTVHDAFRTLGSIYRA